MWLVLKSQDWAVDEALVKKNRAANARNDWHGDLDGVARERIAANRLSELVFRTDIAVVETTQIIRTAEELPVEDRHLGAAGPGVDDADLSIKCENDVVGEKEILRRLDIKSVDVCVAAKEAARDLRREGDAMAVAGEEDTVARVVEKSGGDLAVQVVALLLLDVRGRRK